MEMLTKKISYFDVAVFLIFIDIIVLAIHLFVR